MAGHHACASAHPSSSTHCHTWAGARSRSSSIYPVILTNWPFQKTYFKNKPYQKLISGIGHGLSAIAYQRHCSWCWDFICRGTNSSSMESSAPHSTALTSVYHKITWVLQKQGSVDSPVVVSRSSNPRHGSLIPVLFILIIVFLNLLFLCVLLNVHVPFTTSFYF